MSTQGSSHSIGDVVRATQNGPTVRVEQTAPDRQAQRDAWAEDNGWMWVGHKAIEGVPQSTPDTCWAASLATACKLMGAGGAASEEWWVDLAKACEVETKGLSVKGLLKVLEVSGVGKRAGLAKFDPEGFSGYMKELAAGAVIMLGVTGNPGHALICYALGMNSETGKAGMRIFDPDGTSTGEIQLDDSTMLLDPAPQLALIVYP